VALRILLADPSITAQKMGAKILAAAGYDVVTVSNGVAAIKKIAEMRPDIVLLDVFMAGYSGVEVCKKMKAAAETAQIPILLTFGKLEPFDAGEAITAKADGLVIKPFDDTNLIAAVEKLGGTLRAPEFPTSPRHLVDDFRVSKESTADAQARTDHKTPEVPLAKAIVHAEATPRPSEADQSAPSAHRVETVRPAFSPQRNREVCDVCGHVNQEGTFVCQQCDVPLPSSVANLRHGWHSEI
jgi:CheY-like chemotaxis protein